MELKDSGKIKHFETGAMRDDNSNKPRMDLLPWDLMPRIARWYALGAEKYGDNNWRLGQPSSHVYASIMRHLVKWFIGMKDEDHLAAAVWGILTLMNNETYYPDDKYICDIQEYFEDERPTGKGASK